MLAEVLVAGEKVLGQMIGNWDHAVIATDQKVCIVKAGLMAGQTFGGKATVFDYQNIIGIETRTTWVQGEFEIIVAGLVNNQGGRTMDRVDVAKSPNGIVFAKQQAKDFNAFAAKVRERSGNHAPSPVAATVAAAPSQPAVHPTIEAIRQLAELRTAGILTEDEFSSKKAELLAKM